MSSSTDPSAAAASGNSGEEPPPPPQEAQSAAASPLHHLMFLPKDQWSPRFEDTFYSVKMEGFQRLYAPPVADADAAAATAASLPAGKPSFPAYYYQVVVYRGHQKKTVLRRYSQFKWLHDQLVAHQPAPPPSAAPGNSSPSTAPSSPFPSMPPGTCPWDRQDDAFAAVRHDELADFLTAVLERPGGYAHHEAMVAFLELV